jgi:acylphosphatase
MDSEPAETMRAHIWVKGRVQGVGFRSHVEYWARRITGLTGWVRNVGYDQVEAVVEGSKLQVDQLVEAMKAGPRGARVDETILEWEPVTGEFELFSVRRSL